MSTTVGIIVCNHSRVTAAGNNDRLIALFSTGSIGGSTLAGMTQQTAIDENNAGVWVYDQLLTNTGATGVRTWSGSSSAGGWTVALLGDQSGNRIRMMV